MLLLRGSKASSVLRHSGFCCYVSLCTKGLSPPSFSSFESLQYCLVWVFSSKVARQERYLSSLILFSVLSLLWFVWYFLLLLYFSVPARWFPLPLSSSISCLCYFMFLFQAARPVHPHLSGPGQDREAFTCGNTWPAMVSWWTARLPLLLPRAVKGSSSSLWQAAMGWVPLSWFSPPLVFWEPGRGELLCWSAGCAGSWREHGRFQLHAAESLQVCSKTMWQLIPPHVDSYLVAIDPVAHQLI